MLGAKGEDCRGGGGEGERAQEYFMCIKFRVEL